MQFGEIEETLIDARKEVQDELRLASEQATNRFHRLLIEESLESRAHRQEMQMELAENRQFRSQYLLDSQQSQARQLEKEEGNALDVRGSISLTSMLIPRLV